jgi:hypothetical protein
VIFNLCVEVPEGTSVLEIGAALEDAARDASEILCQRTTARILIVDETIDLPNDGDLEYVAALNRSA